MCEIQLQFTMSKENYTRDNFHSPILRSVIVRIDYSEISNLEQSVSFFHNDLFNFFSGHQTYSLNISADDNSGKVLEQPVHRYFNSKIQPLQNKVVFDVSKTFMCLEIQCNDNYEKIDTYLDVVISCMSSIMNNDSFVEIQRVGIRKVDGDDYSSEEQAAEVFEFINELVPDNEAYFCLKRQKTYIIADLDKGIQVNVNKVINATSSQDRPYRVVLDIDGYMANPALTDDDKAKSIGKLLFGINDALFDLFKQYVCEAFLDQNSHE